MEPEKDEQLEHIQQLSKQQNGKIFGSKNIGINNKNRMVDATVTAYKCLESAFINQPGNSAISPITNLQDKFNISSNN